MTTAAGTGGRYPMPPASPPARATACRYSRSRSRRSAFGTGPTASTATARNLTDTWKRRTRDSAPSEGTVGPGTTGVAARAARAPRRRRRSSRNTRTNRPNPRPDSPRLGTAACCRGDPPRATGTPCRGRCSTGARAATASAAHPRTRASRATTLPTLPGPTPRTRTRRAQMRCPTSPRRSRRWDTARANTPRARRGPHTQRRFLCAMWRRGCGGRCHTSRCRATKAPSRTRTGT